MTKDGVCMMVSTMRTTMVLMGIGMGVCRFGRKGGRHRDAIGQERVAQWAHCHGHDPPALH